MFVDAVEQEKQWAQYLFKDGSMIGLNAQLLDDYIEWICCKRMTVRLKMSKKHHKQTHHLDTKVDCRCRSTSCPRN